MSDSLAWIEELLDQPLAERSHEELETAEGRRRYREQMQAAGLLRCLLAPELQTSETRDAVLARLRDSVGPQSDRLRQQVLQALPRRPIGHRRRFLALAALILLGIGTGSWWLQRRVVEPVPQPIVEGRWHDDATTGWSDSDSVLLRHSDQHWELRHGRLGLQVTPRASDQPLQITTPHLDIAVVGTAFGLAVDATGTRLRLTEGRLQLRQGDRVQELQAGERTRADGAGIHIRPESATAVELPLEDRHLAIPAFDEQGAPNPALIERLRGCTALRLAADWSAADAPAGRGDPQRWAALANALGADLWLEVSGRRDAAWHQATAAALDEVLSPELGLIIEYTCAFRRGVGRPIYLQEAQDCYRRWQDALDNRRMLKLLQIGRRNADWPQQLTAEDLLIDGFSTQHWSSLIDLARQGDMRPEQLLRVAEKRLLDRLADLEALVAAADRLGLQVAVTRVGAWMSYNADIKELRRQFYHLPELPAMLGRLHAAYRAAGVDLVCLGIERMGHPDPDRPVAPALDMLQGLQP